MPYPIALAHKLARKLTEVRKNGTLTYLRPDGKTQVTVEYDEDGKPFRLDAVVLSTQHGPEVSQEQIHADIKKYVFDPILPKDMIDEETKFFIQFPPAALLSEDLTEIPDLPAVRSSLIHTADTPATAAALSPARTAHQGRPFRRLRSPLRG